MTSSSEAAVLREEPQAQASSFSLWPLPELRVVRSDCASGGFAAPAPETKSAEEVAYEKGLQDGRAAMAKELSSTKADDARALAAATEALIKARAACRDEIEQLVLLVAMAVARQFIGQEVKSDPAVLRDIVQRALDVVAWDSKLEVRVHPEDLELLRDLFDSPECTVKQGEVEWMPDPEVGRGGFVVRTPGCLVDGTLDVVLRDMYERMTHA